MKPYHSDNLKHQPYGHRRVILLAWIAKALGVQFSIEGFPYGGKHKPAPWQNEQMAYSNFNNPNMADQNYWNAMNQGSLK